MKLQVQEHPIAALDERPHNRGSRAGEQLEPDLVAADRAAQRVGKCLGLFGGIDIECNEDAVHACSGVPSDSWPTSSSTRAMP